MASIHHRALELVPEGSVIGLGSGRAASAFIEALGEKVRAGFRVSAVPTSRASEDLARKVGVPIVGLEGNMPLAVTIDGADEVDPALNLIKGYGRCLVREKIVATASEKRVILVGRNKLVERLGEKGKLPIEVVAFAVPLAVERLRDMGMSPEVVKNPDDSVFLSDNGNPIISAGIPLIRDGRELELRIWAIPGVVGTGLFLGMADVVLVGDQDNGFELLEEKTA